VARQWNLSVAGWIVRGEVVMKVRVCLQSGLIAPRKGLLLPRGWNETSSCLLAGNAMDLIGWIAAVDIHSTQTHFLEADSGNERQCEVSSARIGLDNDKERH
jgi:hypothetical protein